MGDVHACVYDRHGQGALCLCLGVGLPCWLDIDINSGNSINGAGQDIGRLQRGKGYGVYLSSFVSVYIGGVQGINIQFLDYFCAWPSFLRAHWYEALSSLMDRLLRPGPTA